MKPHILIVEDDTLMREIIAQAIQNAGYNVTQATNGTTAIKLLSQGGTHSPYDVVVTDIVMGDVDGVEVTTVARSQPDAPEVILLTGHGSLDTSMAAIRAGAFDYLLKPCRNTHLLERVGAAVKQREIRRRQENEAEAWQKVVATVSQVQLERAMPDQTTTPAARPPEQQAIPPSLPPAVSPLIEVGALSLDTATHTVRFQGATVHVTRTEYATLACLAERTGQVVTFGEIARQTHGYELEKGEARELVRQHIRNLRKKIDRTYITSVYGVGYMLAEPE